MTFALVTVKVGGMCITVSTTSYAVRPREVDRPVVFRITRALTMKILVEENIAANFEKPKTVS